LLAREAHAIEQLGHAVAPLAAPDAGEQQRVLHVVERRQHRHEVEALEDEAEPIAPDGVEGRRGQVRDAQAAQRDLARLGPIETPDQIQQRGLAAARRTSQRHHRGRLDLERDATERRDHRRAEPVGLGNIDHANNGWNTHVASCNDNLREGLTG
jgi:hypothetical protein